MSLTIAQMTEDIRARWDSQFALIENEFIPWARWYTPIANAKVALISTGGVYLKNGLHQPFDVETVTGDSSFREFPSVVLSQDLALAHGRYDIAAAQEDVNVVFPLERLQELAAAGYIGSVAPFAWSFMGHVTRPVKLLANYAPSVAYRLGRMGADVALVVAVGGLVDHQTAALVARAVELAGVPTVVLGTNRAALEAVKPPRSVLTDGPEAAPLGAPGNAGKHQHLIRKVLEAAWEFEAPGAITEI
ncbi:MAG TPA: glycine/sarcosine/betaine reductase selenoprotein B family protein [Symbiobacteriaceae bacterium]